MPVQDGAISLYLGPALRGAQDSLRQPLESFLSLPFDLSIASQQFADRRLVEILAATKLANKTNSRVLIENDYLFEAEPVPIDKLWTGHGKNEKSRQAFMALTRVGIRVRPDQIGQALQHTNFVISQISNHSGHLLFTSANLSPDSIDRHLNWLVVLENTTAIKDLSDVFDRAWDGNFQDASFGKRIELYPNERDFLSIGSNGETLDDLVEAISNSKESITFAFFNIAKHSTVISALKQAAERGVMIQGIVDADQGNSTWNAVPEMQAFGADVRYYPGALTGASGRMHYKMAEIDGSQLYLGTANISNAAMSSFELGLFFFKKTSLNNAVITEVKRLHEKASKEPIEKVFVP